MSEQNNIKELLQKGIEAAREGDKATAREYFERVTELDENNERGWFWLASVVETDEERRICLGNVLHINPNNERARKALEQLQAKERQRAADEEVVPGVTRRQLVLIIGGAGALVAVIIIVFLILAISRGQQEAQLRAEQTQVAQLATDSANQLATAQAEATLTQIALVTPTPSPTRTPNLPPTFTPTPTPEAAISPGSAALPPPPAEIQGILVGWSGRDILSNGFLPLVTYRLTGEQIVSPGSQISQIGTELGRDTRISADGQRVVYTRYFSETFDFGIEASNLNGTQVDTLNQHWVGYDILLRAQMPAFSPDGSRVAFAAVGQDVQTSNIYILDLSPRPPGADPNTFPSPVTRLTSDNATYTYPAWSPDGTRIAVVRNDTNSAEPGEDIYVIDVQTRAMTRVTTNLGTFIESAPRWSPDSTQLVYAAQEAGNPRGSDIFISNADGTGTPIPIARDPNADDKFPVFSPDGRYIAFASNRNGFYDIYIYDRVNEALWQLTNTEDEDYPGGWWQPQT